jgi:hypothetical protein
MSEPKKPYWFPQIVDAAYLNELREEYDMQGLDDEETKDKFDLHWKYADTWDHLGDARHSYECLADAYLALLAKYPEETPNDQ